MSFFITMLISTIYRTVIETQTQSLRNLIQPYVGQNDQNVQHEVSLYERKQ